MEIKNINTGLCHRRVQENKPSFFVNWEKNGENNYKFFELRFSCDVFEKQLKVVSESGSEKDYYFLMKVYG